MNGQMIVDAVHILLKEEMFNVSVADAKPRSRKKEIQSLELAVIPPEELLKFNNLSRKKKVKISLDVGKGELIKIDELLEESSLWRV